MTEVKTFKSITDRIKKIKHNSYVLSIQKIPQNEKDTFIQIPYWISTISPSVFNMELRMIYCILLSFARKKDNTYKKKFLITNSEIKIWTGYSHPRIAYYLKTLNKWGWITMYGRTYKRKFDVNVTKPSDLKKVLSIQIKYIDNRSDIKFLIKKNICPNGFIFAKDFEEHLECEDCSIWKTCQEAQ